MLENFFKDPMQFYWFCALFGSGIMAVQTILMMFGIGEFQGDDMDGAFDGGFDMDADGGIDIGEHLDTGFDFMKFFSIRAIVAFIAFFGWGGVIWGSHGWIGFFGALLLGLAVMAIVIILIRMLMKMQHTGTVTSAQILGCNGIVYMFIPGGEEHGRVTVDVGGSTREVRAIAEGEMKKGIQVKVIKHIQGNLYKVEALPCNKLNN
jgi:hypothetical protein